jgi:uncharacterized protein YuzE
MCEELSSESVSFSYDKDADVMYISFGSPKACRSTEVEAVVRVDPNTNQLNGITIINFKRKLRG